MVEIIMFAHPGQEGWLRPCFAFCIFYQLCLATHPYHHLIMTLDHAHHNYYVKSKYHGMVDRVKGELHFVKLYDCSEHPVLVVHCCGMKEVVPVDIESYTSVSSHMLSIGFDWSSIDTK